MLVEEGALQELDASAAKCWENAGKPKKKMKGVDSQINLEKIWEKMWKEVSSVKKTRTFQANLELFSNGFANIS